MTFALLLLCLHALPLLTSAVPKDRFWKHITTPDSGLDEDSLKEIDNVRRCLKENLSEDAAKYIFSNKNDDAPASKATVNDKVTQTVNDVDTTLLVEIYNAITPYEAEAIQVLSSCVEEHMDDSTEHRVFAKKYGCNDATYLQVLFQWLLPNVESTVRKIAKLAYDEANWSLAHEAEEAYFDSYPSPYDCGYRTTELLAYQLDRRCTKLEEHGDYGSYYTILFPLSDPKYYRGGETFVRDDNDEVYYIKPRQYSAIAFLSETTHGVTNIVGDGERDMFAVEYWYLDDSPFAAGRPRTEHMQYFVEKYDKMEDQSKDAIVVDEELVISLWSEAGKGLDDWLKSIDKEGMFDGMIDGEQVGGYGAEL